MLNELAKEIHENAKAHGWWEENRTFPEIVALCQALKVNPAWVLGLSDRREL